MKKAKKTLPIVIVALAALLALASIKTTRNITLDNVLPEDARSEAMP